MNRPLISIMLVTYNSADTIIETLDSLDAQTYENLEIILCDDGSRDDTVKIAENWKASHGRFPMTILTKPMNEGTVRNYNKGIKACNAKLIKSIDGDDLLLPEAMEEFYKAYEQDPDAVYTCVPEYFGVDEDTIGKLVENYDSYRGFFNKSAAEQYQTFLTTNPIISSAVGIIHADTYKEVNYYDLRYILMEDYPFYVNVSKAGHPYRLIDKPLARYRINPKSVTNSVNLVYEKDKLKHYLTEMVPALLKSGRKGDALNYGRYYLRKYREAKKIKKNNGK